MVYINCLKKISLKSTEISPKSHTCLKSTDISLISPKMCLKCTEISLKSPENSRAGKFVVPCVGLCQGRKNAKQIVIVHGEIDFVDFVPGVGLCQSRTSFFFLRHFNWETEKTLTAHFNIFLDQLHLNQWHGYFL